MTTDLPPEARACIIAALTPLPAETVLRLLGGALTMATDQGIRAIDDVYRRVMHEVAVKGRSTISPTTRTALEALVGPDQDPLADLVRRFTDALLVKLRAAEAKYGYDNAWARDGWRDTLVKHLHEHLAKGDPRDVAAYCAFAWHHGWSLVGPDPRDAEIARLTAERDAARGVLEQISRAGSSVRPDDHDGEGFGQGKRVGLWSQANTARTALAALTKEPSDG